VVVVRTGRHFQGRHTRVHVLNRYGDEVSPEGRSGCGVSRSDHHGRSVLHGGVRRGRWRGRRGPTATVVADVDRLDSRVRRAAHVFDSLLRRAEVGAVVRLMRVAGYRRRMSARVLYSYLAHLGLSGRNLFVHRELT